MSDATHKKEPSIMINPLAKAAPRRNSIVDVAKAIKIANKPAARFALRRDSGGATQLKKKNDKNGEL